MNENLVHWMPEPSWAARNIVQPVVRTRVGFELWCAIGRFQRWWRRRRLLRICTQPWACERHWKEWAL